MQYFDIYIDSMKGIYTYSDKNDEFEVGENVIVPFRNIKKSAFIIRKNFKENFEFKGQDVSNLSTFLNSPHAKSIEKVSPKLYIYLNEEKKQWASSLLKVLVKADKLTKKQQDELVSQFNFTQASQAEDKVKQGIKEDFGISSQLDVFYIKTYKADGIIQEYKNRDELLAKYKLAKPIVATVHRTTYTTSKSYSLSDTGENILMGPLIILTAPLWIPVAMIGCLNERSGFIDLCLFR